jgi:mRNA interferase RelE/StbE
MNNIEFSQRAERQLRKFPGDVENQIRKVLDLLEKGVENLDIIKIEGEENIYRLRKGDYRIIYEIDKTFRKLNILEITIRGKSYRHF